MRGQRFTGHNTSYFEASSVDCWRADRSENFPVWLPGFQASGQLCILLAGSSGMYKRSCTVNKLQREQAAQFEGHLPALLSSIRTSHIAKVIAYCMQQITMTQCCQVQCCCSHASHKYVPHIGNEGCCSHLATCSLWNCLCRQYDTKAGGVCNN